MTPFTFFPHLYIGAHREWLVVQLKLGLPRLRSLGRGRHACPNLSLWLLYGNASRWLWSKLSHDITKIGGSLFGNTLPLSGPSGLRRGWGRRRLTSALKWLPLPGRPSTEHKTINGHGLLGHHVSTTIRFSIRKVNDF